MEYFQGAFNKISSVFDPLKQRFKPDIPEFLNDQAISIEKKFNYECFLEDEFENVVLLTDGSVGVCWKISPIEHEIYSDLALNDTISKFTKIFEIISNDRACFQIIWDSYPDKDFDAPDYYYLKDSEKTIAQKIMTERINKIKSLADDPGKGLKSMKRDLILTFKLQSDKKLDSYKFNSNLESEYSENYNNLEILLDEFKKCFDSISSP